MQKETIDLKQQNDEQLMSIFSTTDVINSQGAFETLYSRHKGPLYRFISRSINNVQDSNELFQELWFRVINHKSNYDPTQKFTTWIYTIARRLMIDHFRKSAINHADNYNDPKQDISTLQDTQLKHPENEFEAKQMSKQLKSAVLTLPIDQRQTFSMHHDSGFSLREIAEITNQAYERTKSQYRYAVQKLKAALEHFK